MVADGSGRGSLDLSLDGDLADLARERPIRICAHALREGCVFHVLPRAGGIRECCPVRLLLKNLDFLIKNLFFFYFKNRPAALAASRHRRSRSLARIWYSHCQAQPASIDVVSCSPSE